MPTKRYSGWRQAGFTLTEMMAILGVLGILVAIAIPRLSATMQGLSVTQAARQVATNFQLARMRAISQNNQFRLNFVSTTTYTIERANGGAFVTDSGPFSLPNGITFTQMGASSVFQPRGTADVTNGISAVNFTQGNSQVQITAVGRVRVQ